MRAPDTEEPATRRRFVAELNAIPGSRYAVLLCFAICTAAFAAPRPIPADLAALVASARIEGKVLAWCPGEFRSRHPGAFAIAFSSTKPGGRYLVLDPDGSVDVLASFNDDADLSCYSPADAQKLSSAIRGSRTVHGRVSPIGAATVVCEFVDNTHSVCWQYSAKARAFVKVGEWVT
ncbi:MAG: hypothetical protein HY017_21525 [Betaproteobacteria bacterium]|nr:hypothetical protein [Betaproteobacteria bacterium]